MRHAGCLNAVASLWCFASASGNSAAVSRSAHAVKTKPLCGRATDCLRLSTSTPPAALCCCTTIITYQSHELLLRGSVHKRTCCTLLYPDLLRFKEHVCRHAGMMMRLCERGAGGTRGGHAPKIQGGLFLLAVLRVCHLICTWVVYMHAKLLVCVSCSHTARHPFQHRRGKALCAMLRYAYAGAPPESGIGGCACLFVWWLSPQADCGD